MYAHRSSVKLEKGPSAQGDGELVPEENAQQRGWKDLLREEGGGRQRLLLGRAHRDAWPDCWFIPEEAG